MMPVAGDAAGGCAGTAFPVFERAAAGTISRGQGLKEMRIERRFTKEGQSPYAEIEFRKAVSEIRNPDGSIVFRAADIDVPAQFSQVAADILAQKYFRKAGVPARLRKVEENDVPSFLWRSVADEEALAALPEDERTGPETDARQVFDRLAGTWTYWGWKGGYFSGEEDALSATSWPTCSPPSASRPIRRNGSTRACTGPTASTVRGRAIITSIPSPAS
jgi:hypothetical protein